MSKSKVELDDYQASEYAVEFEDKSPQEVLEWALDKFHPKISIACSLQAPDVTIIDMARKINPDARIFVVDTGRLYEEDHDLMSELEEKYGINFEVYSPEPEHVHDMIEKYGINSFYDSVALRFLCCQIRKVVPLMKSLKDLDAWITGLRREQWASRYNLKKIEIDHEHQGIVKINPLADWTWDQVWDYIKENEVPYNKLYDKGYKSIGCMPCTRPVEEDENPRAGRWWWEEKAPKECGMHCSVEFGGFEKYERAILEGQEEEEKSEKNKK
ncbi:phosphoadenosine phosphosulfate reductase [candidate division MSBL1 archaeon SCGC-AAA261O19]|uniref:Adenosine 5'-phosphosulfate reductase n=1 Tax=candidate division MSBL1 archaeon SCGC-AAA261O19 TaxID=1698277 RepID=A0A133VDR3_9EURY|nr:phosphoadenosine phosphosulfate reductase [candidate division MSBL1 archaeon SCGC-AAA261O19]